MAQRDWDMDKRRQRVAEHGAERSEFTDVGEQIRKAKGQSKIHGTDLVKCPLCDGYYQEGRKDEHHHIRYPRPKRQRQFARLTAKGHFTGAKPAAGPLSMVIRDKTGEVVKRVRL